MEYRQFLINAESKDYCKAKIQHHKLFMSCPKHWKNDLIFSTRLGMDFFRETLRIFDLVDRTHRPLDILRLSGLNTDPTEIDKMEFDWANFIIKQKYPK